MYNPILRSSLFATPESLEQLDQFIKGLPDSERAIAYKYTMLAFNLCYKLVEEEKAKCLV